MKQMISAGVALLTGSTLACLSDGDYGCHCVHPAFYDKQREAYMMYYSLMRSHGYETLGEYSPWEAAHRPGASIYSYSEYIPGENPYLGRWKKEDDRCWLSAKDAARMKQAPAAKPTWASRMKQMQAPEPTVVEPSGWGYQPEPEYLPWEEPAHDWRHPQEQMPWEEPEYGHWDEPAQPW